MIIECEKCRSKFKLKESLLKKEGSKVKCSLCKHIFVVYPPEHVDMEESETIAFSQKEIEKDISEDLPGVLQEDQTQAESKAQGIEFDDFLEEEESLEDFESKKTASEEEPFDYAVEDIAAGDQVSEPAVVEEEIQPPGSQEEVVEEIGEKVGATQVAAAQESPRRGLFLPILLVIILVLIGTAAAIFLWAPGLIPDYLSVLQPAEKQELTDMGVRRLSFKDVTGTFVDSENVGNLFVIQGMVSNDYPKSRSFILIKGSLLDDKGQVVMRKLAYAGNSLNEEEIKSLPIDEINKTMKNRYGRDKKNVDVPPGTPTPFTIVFENLPNNLSEFTVEAVSSSAGT